MTGAASPAATGAASWLPWAILVVLLLLALVVTVTLVWAWRRRREAQAEADGTADKGREDDVSGDQMQQLRRALGTVRALTGQGNDPLDVPWLVVADLGDEAGLLEAVEEAPGAGPISLPSGEQVRLSREGVILHAGQVLRGAGAPRRWHRLMRMLRLLRPQRPLDGLVLAVPADLLAGPRAEAAERLAGLGIQACDLVWTAQQVSSARLPIYLVITGCSDLEGFDSLVDALPPEQRSEILGWSSPFPPDTLFEPHWVARGIDELEAGLSAVIIDSTLDDRQGSNTDGMLLFPCALRDLAQPLSALLAALLQPSAYHDTFLFRGFYLTGGRQNDDSQAPAFARRLFLEKIFPERRLVQPLGGMLRDQVRTLRRTRIALALLVVLGIAGLIHVSYTARGNAVNMAPLIASIGRDAALARELRAYGQMQSDSRDALMRVASGNILDSMGPVMVRSLSLWTAPTSYLRDPDGTVEAAIATGYNLVVVKEFGRRLESMAVDLLRPVPVDPAAGDALPRVVDTVNGLEELNRHAKLYFGLPDSRSTDDLRRLADYTLKIKLGDDFVDHADLYGNALAATKPQATLPSPEQIEAALTLRMDGVFAARYTVEPLAAALQRIGETARGVPPVLSGSRNVLGQMRDDLRFVQRNLASTGYGWLNANADTLGDDIEDALARMLVLHLVSEDGIRQIRANGARARVDARARVLEMVRDGDLPLLKVVDGRLVLAADMATLADVLDQILARPFMTPARPSGAQADGRRPLVWDSQATQDMTASMNDYKAFLEQDLLKCPLGMQPLARAAGRERFARHGQMLLERAAHPLGPSRNADDAATFNEIRSFAQVAQPLLDLRIALYRMGHAELAQALDDIAGRQARRLLGEMDRSRPVYVGYLPADPTFGWWDGRTPFAARAYGVTTLPDLAQILGADRQALAVLATDSAEPLVNYLAGQPANGAPLLRWQEILAALKSYDQKDGAANGLRNLERLVLSDLDKIDIDTCSGLPTIEPADGEYFAERAAIILEGVTTRCAAVSRQRLRESYLRLRQSFNATLAGRFPFADTAMPTSRQADPDEVRRFFRAFAREIGPDGMALTRLDPAVARFLDGLAAANQVLAPMLADASLAMPLVYEVEADFRTNAASDQGGDMVIAWQLDLGNQSLRSLDPGGKALWVAGQPVKLSLRLARNAAKAPRAEAGGPAVDGATAVWEARGPWSLLSLIEAHKPLSSVLPDLPDATPHTLRLEIPLQDNPQKAKGVVPAFDTAVVYLRLKLTAVSRPPGQPEVRTAITLPSFPAAAPALLPGEVREKPP